MAESFVIGIYISLVGMVTGSYFLSFLSRGTFKQTMKGRSKCEHCQQTIQAIDLIPVISYLLLRGKCRFCHQKIPFYFPLIEVITGVLFFLSWYYANHFVDYVMSFLLISLLILLTLTDIRSFRIPNRILLLFSIPLLALRFFVHPITFDLFSLVISLVLLSTLLYACQKEQLGGGDVKLFLLFMLLFGIQSTLLIIAVASSIALLFVFIHPSFRQKYEDSKRMKIPFAPFISIAALIVYFLPYVV
ncbi:leader peptidase [Bacillus sp. JCM 19047]|nr:leader peptidase [Bacillus sp. JCM 19047]